VAGADADQIRTVPVEDGTHRTWRAERYGNTYLFIGPVPGNFLFYSTTAHSWQVAILEAKSEWRTRNPQRRDAWYGETGRYTLFTR